MVVGGGHGQAVTLRSVVPWAGHVTAIVSTADDGGSTGRLRESWDVPALGDVRRCIAALADARGVWARLLERRFDAGELKGHPLGNLVLLALVEELGDLQLACDEVARTSGVDLHRARVVPVTDDAVVLGGRTVDGTEVVGQVAVAATDGIDQVWVDPGCTAASPIALEAISRADLVVLGPGSLYTSVLAAAVVGDLRQALSAAPGRTVYVGNLRADSAETRGYDLADHVRALERHGIRPDLAVAPRGGLPLADPGIDVVEADVAGPDGLFHEPVLLGAVLAGLERRSPI
ncbi:MAG: YvcK family protein [Acidimicrobiales bacterium]|nr:YvcK family protein [Acidimicrobiales bacterium]